MALRAFCEVPVNQEKQTGECGVRDFDAPAEPRSLGGYTLLRRGRPEMRWMSITI